MIVGREYKSRPTSCLYLDDVTFSVESSRIFPELGFVIAGVPQ